MNNENNMKRAELHIHTIASKIHRSTIDILDVFKRAKDIITSIQPTSFWKSLVIWEKRLRMMWL